MIFNAKTEETNLITIDNTTIERVWEKGKETSFKLVGIHVDEKLKWDQHINKTNNKIASAIYGLTKCAKELSSENKKLLYSGLCLLYTSPSPRDRQKSRMPSSA